MNYYWLIWSAVLLSSAFFIRRLNIFVNVVYLKKADIHSLSVSVSLFKRLKLYTFQFSPADFFRNDLPNPQPVDGEDNVAPAAKRRKRPRGEDNFNMYRQPLSKLAASLFVEKFHFSMIYGFEDAALTAVSNGVLSALRGIFLAVCGAYLKMKAKPDISFSPVYGRDRLEVEFDCIFSIRLGNVIAITTKALLAGIVIFLRKIPNLFKEAKHDGGTSYSGLDENCYGKHQRHG